MDLIVPNAAALHPLEQSAGLLLLGQGFATRTEFLTLARTTAANICSIAPLGTTVSGATNAGKLTVLADACLGIDLGVTAALPAAPRAVGIGTGAQLEQALGDLVVPAVVGSATTVAKANAFWGPTRSGGPTGKLVAIIRKPAAGATPGEFYSLPVIVIDVDPARDWWRLIVRGLTQSLAGLADEFTRDEPDWAAPPAGWLADPQAPAVPPNAHLLGANTIMFNAAQGAKLGTERLADIFPKALDPAWTDRYRAVTPYRATPLGPVTGAAATTTIRVAQGAAGFRTGVLRCDQPCLLAQVPAEPLGTTPPPRGDPVGTRVAGAPPVELCPVCRALVARAIGTGRTTSDSISRHVDRQASHWDMAAFTTHTPITSSAPQAVSETMTRGATWKFTAAVGAGGLVIRDLKLANRPNDPMADSEDVAESINFVDFAYETSTGKHDLDVADALANVEIPPVFEVGRNSLGMLRVGVRLTMHWQPEDGLTIRADLSLVCRDIAFDFDPGGAAEACKFYPELVLTWTRRARDVAQVRRLHGTVTIVANNRITGAHHGHSGMVHNSQLVMLLTDSNSSKDDSDYSLVFGSVQNFLTGRPELAHWRSGRILGALDRAEGAAVYSGWKLGQAPLLPEWSWLFDYGRAIGVAEDELVEVVCWEDTDPVRGAPRAPGDERRYVAPWPPIPDTTLGFPAGKPPAITVVKMPRQGAFDNIHLNADMGVDAKGRQVVAAPFCADVCLHLHVRWGVHAVDAGNDKPPFLGWSSGTHAYSHTTLGAPLVPPNQRISFGISRPDATRTTIRYVAEIAGPKAGKPQVVLEQGLGFAFTYSGLGPGQRIGLRVVYGAGVSDPVIVGFLMGFDQEVREFFANIYKKIRFLTWGYPALLPAPQQIPADYFADPDSVGELVFFRMVDL